MREVAVDGINTTATIIIMNVNLTLRNIIRAALLDMNKIYVMGNKIPNSNRYSPNFCCR